MVAVSAPLLPSHTNVGVPQVWHLLPPLAHERHSRCKRVVRELGRYHQTFVSQTSGSNKVTSAVSGVFLHYSYCSPGGSTWINFKSSSTQESKLCPGGMMWPAKILLRKAGQAVVALLCQHSSKPVWHQLWCVHMSRGTLEGLFLHWGVFRITDTMTVPQSGYFFPVALLSTNCKMDQ